MHKDEIKDENEKKLISEDANKALYGPRDMNIKKKLYKKTSSPKEKILLFRDMKILYGNMTEEEKKNLKTDENYKRYLKFLKNTKRKKY